MTNMLFIKYNLPRILVIEFYCKKVKICLKNDTWIFFLIM